MSYIKAEEILPEDLIRAIQEYADGVYIYIPRKPGTLCPLGQWLVRCDDRGMPLISLGNKLKEQF